MLEEEVLNKELESRYKKSLDNATLEEVHDVVADLVSQKVSELSKKAIEKNAGKRCINYLSIEFLIGNCLWDNLWNLKEYTKLEKTLSKHNISIDKVIRVENDAGLGNGGLGRLAACFMESVATLGFRGIGHSLLYRYGLFKQVISNCEQKEEADEWLNKGKVWLNERKDLTVKVKFGGNLKESVDYFGNFHYALENDIEVEAVPYDLYITGDKVDGSVPLRLWKANYIINKDKKEEDEIRLRDEISKINDYLYPADDNEYGKVLRLWQEYFLSSAAMQDIVNNHLARGHKITTLAKHMCIHLNDTHPVLSIPELMRILLDDYNLSWEDAWKVLNETVGYTNHTVLSEALEIQSLPMIQKHMPRIASILKEMDRRLRKYLLEDMKVDPSKIENMAIISNNRVNMTNVAIYASKSINGVSAIHTEILKDDLFNDYYKVYPEKFVNITNGVSHRKWLAHCNPALDKFISKRVGKEYATHAELLKGLEKYAGDRASLKELKAIKLENKKRLAEYLKDTQGIEINPEGRIDVHVKRIHEYKRQLLNVLRIIYLYSELKKHPDWDMTPQTFIFGGKAASSYYMAKRIIKLISKLANEVNNDPIAKGRMSVVFIANFNVTVSEILLPASDVSEQISLVGKEASGTGNMKAIFNGALMMNTIDGANIEIMEKCGIDNSFGFGMTNEERLELLEKGYRPHDYFDNDERVRRVISYLDKGFDGESFHDISQYLLGEGPYRDNYMCLADFNEYLRADALMDITYRNEEEWYKKTLLSIARNGYFSSDRSIKEYVKKIWKL